MALQGGDEAPGDGLFVPGVIPGDHPDLGSAVEVSVPGDAVDCDLLHPNHVHRVDVDARRILLVRLWHGCGIPAASTAELDGTFLLGTLVHDRTAHQDREDLVVLCVLRTGSLILLVGRWP